MSRYLCPITMSHSGVSEYQLRPRSHVSGYFESPDSASVHAYPVYPADESAIFESSLQSGDFLIPYVSRNVLTDRLVLYREYWIFKTVRAKKKLRIQKYPDTCERANSFCIRIRVGVEIFVSGKKKLSVQKYPDACGWRLRKTTKNVWQKTNKQTMTRIVVDLGQKSLDQSRTKPRLALVLDALPYLIKWEPLVIHFTFTSFEGLDQSPSTPPYLIPYQHLLSGSGQFMSAPLTPPLTLPVSRLKVWISAPPYLTLPVSQLKVWVWISAPPYLTLPVSRVKVSISAPPYYTLPYQYLDSRSG